MKTNFFPIANFLIPKAARLASGMGEVANTHRCRAIIFDVDGLLLATESLYNEATRRVLRQYGFTGNEYTDDVRQHVVGVDELTGMANAVRLMGVNEDPHVFLEKREKELVEMFPDCEAMPGAKELVLAVLDSGVPCALATSANRPAFELKVGGERGGEACEA